MRVYPTGSKSFVVSYWINGRRRFYTIGRYGRITLHQARRWDDNHKRHDLERLIRSIETHGFGEPPGRWSITSSATWSGCR